MEKLLKSNAEDGPMKLFAKWWFWLIVLTLFIFISKVYCISWNSDVFIPDRCDGSDDFACMDKALIYDDGKVTIVVRNEIGDIQIQNVETSRNCINGKLISVEEFEHPTIITDDWLEITFQCEKITESYFDCPPSDFRTDAKIRFLKDGVEDSRSVFIAGSILPYE
ncbi:hypothetical protein GOV09_01005 [Candidatus Woesearchaeota archaeon]|nr:hypothetical protein [Candidatus Woesearchaeota archaeon]